MPRASAETLRDKILDSAVELLREHGASGLSQPRVAKRAGIPQGHLTYYFPRKSDLLAAVARRFHDEIQLELAQVGMRVLSGDVRSLGKELLVRLIRDDGRTRTLLGLLVASESDSELRTSLRAIVDEGRPSLGFLLGLEPDDPAIDLVLAVSWGLQVEQRLYRRSPRAVARLVDSLFDRLASFGATPRKSPARTSARRSRNRSTKRGDGA